MNISETFRTVIKSNPEMKDVQVMLAAMKLLNINPSSDEGLEWAVKRAGYAKYYRSESKKAEKMRATMRAEILAEMTKE